MSQNVRARLVVVYVAAQLISACSPSDIGIGQPSSERVLSDAPVPVTPGVSANTTLGAPPPLTLRAPELALSGVASSHLDPTTTTVPEVTPPPAGVASCPAPVTDPMPLINQNGDFPPSTNTFGLVGSWHAFGGHVRGDEDFTAHSWASERWDQNNPDGDTKPPYDFDGKLTPFSMPPTGTVPAAARIHLVNASVARTKTVTRGRRG